MAVLVLATLAISHELIYLIAHGPGDGYRTAMTDGGHDAYWMDFVLVVSLTCGSLLAVASVQLRRLSRQAAAIASGRDRSHPHDGGLGSLLRLTVPLWGRVALLSTLAFLAQENIETASVGQAMPGLGVIAGQQAVALPLFVLVSFGVALVRALVRWRRDVLLARTRGQASARRPSRPVLRPAEVLLRSATDGIRCNCVRGPPFAKPSIA